MGVIIQDSFAFYEEMGLTATNEQGQTVAERIQKTDLMKKMPR